MVRYENWTKNEWKNRQFPQKVSEGPSENLEKYNLKSGSVKAEYESQLYTDRQ